MGKNNKIRTCGMETLTGSSCKRRIGQGKQTCSQHSHVTGKRAICKVPKNTKNISWSQQLTNVKYVPKKKQDVEARKGKHLIPYFQMTDKEANRLWDCAVFTLGEKYDVWDRNDYMSEIRKKRTKKAKKEMRECAVFLGWIKE